MVVIENVCRANAIFPARNNALMKNIPIRHITANQNEPDFYASFSIRDIKDLLAGREMNQELHRHDFFFVLVLKKGRGDHAIDFIPYKICDHSVFFMRPGQVHALTLKAESRGYLMEFKNDFYFPHDKTSLHTLRKASITNFYQPDTNGFKKILVLLDSIFQEYTNQRERYQEVVTANLNIFFIELLRLQQHSNSASKNANTYAHDRLEEFYALLEKHVAKHKQVSHYAGMLNVSPYQLNAMTKETRGKTCSELIEEYIMLESKRYLLATASQVTQIAYHLGYEDVSYFIRFFKKHTGYSPEAFRKNFR
jgi:AraC-like DNA-binding protein